MTKHSWCGNLGRNSTVCRIQVCVLAIAAVCIIATAGCKAKMVATVYTSDVRLAVEGDTSMTATLDIALDVSSESNCKEHSSDIEEALRTQYSDVEFVGCEDAGFETFANFRVQAPIIVIDSEQSRDTTAPVYVGVVEQDNGISIGFVVVGTRLENMKASLPESLTMYGDIEAQFHASISNDERNSVKVLVGGAFANGSPVVLEEWFELKRRGIIDIMLSDVANSWLQMPGSNAAPIAHIEYP